jgi:ABC-2 type transport system permease protein
MAVYKRTYKAYSGPLTPSWSRFSVLSRYGFSTLFSSRIFTAYTVLCFIPFLVGLGFIYFVHSSTAQLAFGQHLSSIPLVNGRWFFGFLVSEAWMGLILTAWAAPGMISKDFANNSVQLYLSRPLSRAEYLVGKVTVLGVLLSFVTWIPMLVLFFLQAELEGHGWLGENWWMAGSIVLAGLMWIALISLLSMALAVWVKWRIAASALMLAFFFVLPGFGEAFSAILRTPWGSLLNFNTVILMIWAQLFRIPLSQLHFTRFGEVPPWAPWLSVLAVCTISLWLLHRRLKAREVERG